MKNSYQSISYVALLLLVFSSLETVSATDPDLFLHCLSTSAYTIPKGQLANITYTPSSKNYTIVLQDSIRNARFNTSTTLKPNVIVTPSKESQVQDIVLCAQKVGLQLRIVVEGTTMMVFCTLPSPRPRLLFLTYSTSEVSRST